MLKKRYVKIITFTWTKDIHGLFDFENKELLKNEFEIHESMKFYRKVNFIFTEKELKQTSNENLLFSINKNIETSNQNIDLDDH